MGRRALAPSLVYAVKPIVLPATESDPEVETSRLELIGESPHNGRALLAVASEEERLLRDDAAEYLIGELGDGQRHAAEDLFKTARKNGISDRTLQRARKAIGAETEKAGFGRGWEWWLPKAPSETSKPAFLHEGVVSRETAPSAASSTNGDLTAYLERYENGVRRGLVTEDEMTQLALLDIACDRAGTPR